jgi:hypothetical protein
LVLVALVGDAFDGVWLAKELVITEMEVFPKGRYDDLTDSTTQAIRYLRDNGLLRSDRESISGQRTACGIGLGRSLSIRARSQIPAFRLIRPADQR